MPCFSVNIFENYVVNGCFPFFVWDKRRESKGADYKKTSNSKGDSYIVGAFKKMPNRIADLAIASVAPVIGIFLAAGKIPPLLPFISNSCR